MTKGGWKGTRYSPISICIGNDTIHLIQLKEMRGDFSIIAAESAEIIPDSNREKAIYNAIHSCLSEGEFKGTKTALCLTGNDDIFVQHQRLSRDAKGAIEDRIMDEFRRNLPFDPDRAEIRFMTTRKKFDQSETLDEVILMIADREIVKQYISLFKKLKLAPIMIGVESLALLRTFLTFPPPEMSSQDITAFMNISSSKTELMMIRNQSLAFTRTFPIGGEKFTSAIQEKINLDFESAERLKKAVSRNEEVNSALKEAVNTAFRPVVDEICNEIRSCFRYFSSITNRESVVRLIIAGEAVGGVVDPKFIESQIELPVFMWDTKKLYGTDSPFIEDQKEDSGFIPGIGMAIESLYPTEGNVDFLPKEILEKRNLRHSLLIRASFFAAIILFMGLILFVLNNRKSTLNHMYDMVRNRINLIDMKNDALGQLKDEKKVLNATKRLLDSAKPHTRISRTIGEIANATSEGLSITSMKMTAISIIDQTSKKSSVLGPKSLNARYQEMGYSVQIKGLALKSEDVSSFMENLSMCKDFSSIDDEGFKDEMTENLQYMNFSLKLTIREGVGHEVY